MYEQAGAPVYTIVQTICIYWRLPFKVFLPRIFQLYQINIFSLGSPEISAVQLKEKTSG